MAATNEYVMPRLDGLPYLDKPVVYFAAEAAAMMAFYFAVEATGDRRQATGPAQPLSPVAYRLSPTKWSAIAWSAMALGVLTKGPVAILVPLLIAIPYAIRRKAFRALWSVA